MKLKIQKQKMLVLSVSIFLIGLIVTTNINAFTSHTVEYPAYVPLGETMDINIIFSYDIEANCLYGLYAWFHWMVNDVITSSWTSGSRAYIYDLENYPRPTNVSWTFDTSVMNYGDLETDDVITFKIQYRTGHDWGDRVTFEGIVMTDNYEITIGEITTERTSFTIAFIPIIVLAIALMASKESLRKAL